ncbi:xylulokinase [Roseivirga sp.]|uniref:xylulokinase n=1 Tax=Roseivirga sp. TaxID=1964215 RepID=UPI003B8D6504
MYFLGYDIGSSSIKAALVNADSLEEVAVVKYPEHEQPIHSENEGWAEQDPEDWWKNLVHATDLLLTKTGVDGALIVSIGIAYQMHGLVLVDEDQNVLRPSIIWCDSRAVDIGNEANEYLGNEFCLNHLLNSPGNFTASKLGWMKKNEPEIYKKVFKFMLPGDYIAMKLTGEITTTIGGLSEGIFWDFKNKSISQELLEYLGIDSQMIPDIVEGIGHQGRLSDLTASTLGLKAGIPIAYRAGDQPNNAMALNVLKPGELAATGGTSGVIYGVTDQPTYDLKSRVNGFAHVNYTQEKDSIGILLCINGAGIQYSWVRKMLGKELTYGQIEQQIENIEIGAEGLSFLPFGNGAERIFENKTVGSHLLGIDLNRHHQSHVFRATIEGIAFAFVYGARIMESMRIPLKTMKVGNDNLFQSKVFSKTIATLLNCNIEVYNTTGAYGAAKASGVGAGFIRSMDEAMSKQNLVNTIEPDGNSQHYQKGFEIWSRRLEKQLKA